MIYELFPNYAPPRPPLPRKVGGVMTPQLLWERLPCHEDPRHSRRQSVLRGSTSDPERAAISVTTLLTLVRALIVSKVDYCNSVLAGSPGQLQDRLQSVLNAAARLIFSARRSERITPLLRELYWLRVPERVTFGLSVLAYRCLHGTAPAYLAESLLRTSNVDTRVTRRRPRSADSAMLVVPSTRRSTLDDHAFPVASASAWNSLPSSVRNAPSLTTFRRELKTVLFRSSFDND